MISSIDYLVTLFTDYCTCVYIDFCAHFYNTSFINDTKIYTTSPLLATKLSPSGVWGLVFFSFIFYLITIFSLTMSTLPLVFSFTNHNFKNSTNYLHVTSWTLYKFASTPLLLILLVTLTWTSVTVNSWFGHLTMSSLQRNVTLLSVVGFFLVYYIYSTTLIYNTKDVYDFVIVLFNTLIWTFLLFYANNFFTIVFFIEILTGLTTLFLITSSFSSTYNYQVSNFSKSMYFSSILPKNTLDTLIFFFWMSLVSSLLLFVFMIFFYTHLFTFEFTLIEIISSHVLATSTFKNFLTTVLVSSTLIILVFLKCGLVPLYVWKPIVFKGMTLHVIFFYICFYYYFLLTFFVYLFIAYCHTILWESKIVSVILLSFLLMGMVVLFFIIIESYYFKSFLAMSSILNTLLIFLGMSSLSTSNYLFII